MKRSQINREISHARAFCAGHGFHLPPFAAWTAGQWSNIGPEADEIRSRRLGWDVTDMGSGNFHQVGLTLFTLRNGRLDDPHNRKIYAEKLMICYEQQVVPFHFHWLKTEDIINRGAGVLIVELYEADRNDEGRFQDSPVRVSCDGIVRELPAGGQVELGPGQSITLPPYLYHRFWAKPGHGTALLGEVSSVNDDATDNRFHQPLPRFPAIDEDEPPVHLLCTEYPRACE